MLTPRSLWGRSDFRDLLPLKCPWRISSGTQRAESPIIQDIAAEVPLEDKILPLKCPWRISSGTQRAKSPIIQDIAA